MLPSDKSMLPPLHVSVPFSAAFGIATAGCANLIHNKPFLMGPSKIVIGGIVGAISGYLLHTASERSHERNLASQAYRERYAEYQRTHKAT